MGFDLLIGSWSFGLVEDVSELFETREANRGALNLFGYSDPEVDSALEAWRRARSLSEAQGAYHRLHARLAEDRPYLFLWKLDTRSAWRTAVRDNVIAPYWYYTDFDAWRYLPEGERADEGPSR
jgi:peptide/nickel transport system substrate-binding protein